MANRAVCVCQGITLLIPAGVCLPKLHMTVCRLAGHFTLHLVSQPIRKVFEVRRIHLQHQFLAMHAVHG